MSFREVIPAADLRLWVDRFWIRSAASLDTPVSILPDGCADIVLDLSGSPGRLSGAFAVGPMTRPLVLRGPTPAMLGIRFRPGRAAAALRMSLAEIVDSRVPLTGWSPIDDIEGLQETLRRKLAPATVDSRVDAATDLILRRAGNVSIQTVAAHAGLTRQHLARLFELHVGLRPKLFARIVRFRHALRLGRRAPGSHVAAALGYTDQSHLISEFREFAGTSPVPFFLSVPTETR